jgi:hypothetical protein
MVMHGSLGSGGQEEELVEFERLFMQPLPKPVYSSRLDGYQRRR